MIYSLFSYCYLSCVFLWGSSLSSSETHANPTFCSRTSATSTTAGLVLTTDRVSSRPDHTTHTLHQAANPQFTHQQNMVPHSRDHQSNQTIMTLITNPAKQIKNSEDWHRWFQQRREQLQTRLKQAEQAEWNWPSTRARCEVMRIEDEIKQLDAEEFVVPF